MDISFTNVLEGARQYFQGLPAGTSTPGGPAAIDQHQQPQQQQQPHLQINPAKRSSSANENDGSVRSEQHSAVPVYWDQQNEGQAAANLTNRDASLMMNQQQPRPASGALAPPNQTHSPFHTYKNNYAATNGANAKSESVSGYQPAAHPHIYQSHISTVQQAGTGASKTYYELQTNRSSKATYAAQTSAKPTETARMYYPTEHNHYYTNPNQHQPNPNPNPSNSTTSTSSSSSSQDVQAHYNYKMYAPNAAPVTTGTNTNTSRANPNPNQYTNTTVNYYHPQTSQQQAQPQSQPPAQPPQPPRRHLPVQPASNTNTYHRTRPMTLTNNPKANSTNVAYSANKSSTFNGNSLPASNNYSYYQGQGPANVARPAYTYTHPATAYQQQQQQQHRPNAKATNAKYLPPPTAAPTVRLPLPKAKRESPLDLSVKTVRTTADSTLTDHDERTFRARYEQYTARAPKVDFSPNFALQQEQAPQVQQQVQPQRSNNYYNYPYATSTLPKVDFDFQQRKRSMEHGGFNAIPEKQPKVDTWRQNIDKQIDQRLNSYAKALEHQVGSTSSIANGTSNNAAAHAYPPHYSTYYQNSNAPSGKPSTKEAQTTKPQANKKVLNLLRTSLQNKGKSTSKKANHVQEPLARNYREVLQPSTDVMAPLQPKNSIVGRRNVSPFTAASLERNSNTPPTYKFHIPKAIDSVIISDGEKEQEASSTDLDGLAAFLAARIRTKAELKQVGTSETAGNNNGLTTSSPPKMKTEPGSEGNSGTTTPVMSAVVNNSNVAITPKKLFGRSELKRSEVRSSSETSVFDFPDSDNETEMPVLERQSLVNMRKDRRTLPGRPAPMDEEDERTASPFSLLFQQTCDSFVEQLKCGNGKKRGRRKKDELSNETLDLDFDLEIKQEIEEVAIVIKQEPLDLLDVNEEIPSAILTTTTITTLETTAEIIPKLEQPTPEEIAPIIKETVLTVVPVVPEDDKQSDTDSDTPLVKIATKQKKKFTKKDSKDKEQGTPKKMNRKQQQQQQRQHREDKELASSDSEVETLSRNANKNGFYELMKSPIAICKPGKKPTFGDGSDFRPGWEDALYKYKKSIRIPMQLIQVTRPPSSQRLSSSLPDLDPCPISPNPKTESMDSDLDSSNCSFSFTKAFYDSDQGSMKSFSSKSSILDKLLERYGGRKRKRIKREEIGPRMIPKSENELLPTPSLEIKDVIVKSTSALLGFRKKTIEDFKDAFMNNSNKIIGVNEFNTIVLKARTRTETRVLKEKATIREVFGEDRPASAPPVTCVDELKPDTPNKGKEKENQLKKDFNDVLFKAIESKKLEIDAENIKKEKEDDNVTVISTDSVETIGRKKNKLRRKFSSGFDYIRKKKKQIKKDDLNDDVSAKSKRRSLMTKATPVSVDDIQKEIKQWVLNKGVGETHLHRASRSGYTDITAYCLEKMSCNPSPKDNAGYTPLHEACSRGHLDIARILLEYGAQVSESAQGGIRPLHEAAENGYVEIVRLLLSYGADPTLATYGGLTPLQLASDDSTIALLEQHVDELQGRSDIPWLFSGPAKFFDGFNEGYDPLIEAPDGDPLSEIEDIEFEASEHLLPNLYILPNSEASDRWVLLQDLSNVLKIKSRETLLRQLQVVSIAKSDLVKEMKMNEFLEKARCCQFMNANEKLNTRSSKIFLVKYTDKVKRLLNVENITFTNNASR